MVEPKLPKEELVIIRDFPASQAALARTSLRDGEAIAERFEVYFNGIELANGYHELTDVVEQRRRFLASNEERQKLGKAPLPLDEILIQAQT